MTEPDTTGWRQRCPRGHVTVKTVGNTSHTKVEKGFRCTTCRIQGHGAEIEYIVDAKTGVKKTP